MNQEGKKRSYGFHVDNSNAEENEASDAENISSEGESFESEPELECDFWDDSIVSINLIGSNAITGCHLIATCPNDPIDSQIISKKKLKIDPSFRSTFTKPSSLTYIQNCWSVKKPVQNNNFEILTNPFRMCVIKDFLESTTYLEELRQELYELNFNLRNMDLYEFFQSRDLLYLTSEKIKTIYDFLKTDVMEWVATITGLNLTHISTTCSLYSNTDYLLVHDDQREDRMVAFILYLTDQEGWHEKDGGSLQLFSKDANGQPSSIVRSIEPANNQLVFFPVTNDSYHQVAEVTNLSKYRLSINGWFHTRTTPVFDIPVYHPPKDGLYSNNYKRSKTVDTSLESWINDDYLERNSIKQIQKHIEEYSEISLQQFFKKESLNELLKSLQHPDIIWRKMGPTNRFSYHIADPTSLPLVIETFLDLFQSTLMFNLLHKYTDLDLNTETSSVKYELQKWVPGSYALLTEHDWQERNELDLIIYFGCEHNSSVIGARTYYVTVDDEVQNALITIEPEENSLNIVYRDSARFTKYFSKQSKCQCFYTLICSYSE